MADEPVRASERFKAIATSAVQGAVSVEKVRAAFATKLVAIGLALICFAGGVDYFSHGEDVSKALAGIARAEGQGALVDDLQKVGGRWAAIKASFVAMLPDTMREYVLWLSLLPGAIVFAWGLRLKLGGGTQAERGRALWDLGRIVLGPGLVGVVAYLVVAVQGFPVLRRTTSGFVDKVRNGSLTLNDVSALTAKYHGWVWTQVGAVLVLGIALSVLAFVLGRVGRGRVPLDVLRRAAWSGSMMALTYYAGVTAVAVASYGAALNVVTWPWKVRGTTFVLTLGLMALGAGIAWTGRALMRQPAEEDATAPPAEPEPAPEAKKGKKKRKT